VIKQVKKNRFFFIALIETPYAGVGNSEALKYELSGFWSRKIKSKEQDDL